MTDRVSAKAKEKTMTERRATRTPARAALGRDSTPARSGTGRGGSNRPSAFIRGEQGMRRTDEEIERSLQRAEQRKNANGKPFRFFVPVGETRQIIVCDDKPDFFLYEHALKDQDGKWGRLFSGCIKEFDNCPVCRATGKESSYVMILTVIDLTPFSTRDGDEIDFSRKMLVVKPKQQKKFLRFFHKEGTLRGALFDMTRDGDKDPSIGNDIDFVEFVPEEEMEGYVRQWRDRDGKNREDHCHEPYDYESIFEEPTMENLIALVGGEHTPGSRAADERELGGHSRGRDAPRRDRGDADGWEDDDDKREYGSGRGSGQGGRRIAGEADAEPQTRRSVRGTARDNDQQDLGEAPERPARARAPEAPAARRSAARGRTAGIGADDAVDSDGYGDDTGGGATEGPSRAGRTRRPSRDAEGAEAVPLTRATRARSASSVPDEAPEVPRRTRATSAPRSRAALDGSDEDIPF